MKTLWAGAVAALALTGCGTICDDMLGASDTYATKVSPCRSAARPVPEAFNITQCERALDKCTDSEKEAIGKYADCLRALPECTPSSEKTFDNAVEGCQLQLNGKVGDSCLTSL